MLDLVARHDAKQLAMLSLLGTNPPANVVVNELTTVASAFTAARFIDGESISGNPLGLRIAAGNTPNLVNPTTGGWGDVLLDPLNSTQTTTLAKLNTLGSMITAFATVADDAWREKFLKAATPPSGVAPKNTLEAMVGIARTPWAAPKELYALFDEAYPQPKDGSRRSAPFVPYLAYVPDEVEGRASRSSTAWLPLCSRRAWDKCGRTNRKEGIFMKRLILTSTAIAGLFVVGVLKAQGQPVVKPNTTVPSISESIQSFTAAFDRGDAQAVAAHWTEDGDYVDENGQKFHARAAISAEYKWFFTAYPGVKIELQTESVRLIDANNAIEDGYATLDPLPQGIPARSRYSAMHTKKDGQWLMTTVRVARVEVI